MLKQLVYSLLGVSAAGALSICDLCKPQLARAFPSAAAVSVITPTPSLASAVVLAPAVVPTTVRLKVAGMTCGGCVVGTRTVLNRLAGVTKADVSYERQEAVVTYDPAKVTVAQIIAAIKTLGYTATVARG